MLTIVEIVYISYLINQLYMYFVYINQDYALPWLHISTDDDVVTGGLDQLLLSRNIKT